MHLHCPLMTDWYLKLTLLCAFVFSTDAEFDGRWPVSSSSGLCRYGGRVDCCWGWSRNAWGQCQPVCHHGCKHGQCAGPNKCKCHPGYAGKTCNQEVHICSMVNCQYGCDSVKGEGVRCHCSSPGLHLAPDGHTCVDVDECAAGLAACPRMQRCVNTFGGYVCRCPDGFVPQLVNGKQKCTAIPKVIIEPPRPGKTPAILPTTPKHPLATTAAPNRRRPNPRPTHKPAVPTRRYHRPAPRPDGPGPATPTRPSPYHPRTPTFRVTPEAPPPRRALPPLPGQPVTPSVDNRIAKVFTPKQRGDVHIPRRPGQGNGLGFDFDVELGNTDEEELADDPDAGVLSCSFDYGLCSWMSHRQRDTQWEVTESPSGGKHLSLPDGSKPSGRGAQLALRLPSSWGRGYACVSFRHKMAAAGHVGVLQVFADNGGGGRGRGWSRGGGAVWAWSGGGGGGGGDWRSAQVTLWADGLENIIIKGERRRGRHGEIALDDVTLSRGRCGAEHHLSR